MSLISVAYLLRSLGRYDPVEDACFDDLLAVPNATFPAADEIVRLQQVYEEKGGQGRRLMAIRHAGRLGAGLDDLTKVEGRRSAPIRVS